MSSPSFNVPKNQKPSRADIVALIRHTLSILAQPGQTVELRIPGMQGKRTDSGYFNDFDKLASVAADYETRAEGVYITVNPVQPALLARSSNHIKEYAKQTTADKDVLRRRWIFIDFDPVRPAGISSSDEENAAALERASACREWLVKQAIPALLANSGNGAHLLIPIDWPNDDASTALIKTFLLLLDAEFSDERVKVDIGMVGAGHLIKLYGTLARKGDHIPERPHRRSAIVDVPPSLEPVAIETVQKLVTPSTASSDAKHGNAVSERSEQANDTSDRRFIDEVKARLDMVAYAEQQLGVQAIESGHEFRLPGNAGFLINPEKGVWYHHGGQEGGDALDLVGHCLFGSTWNKRDSDMFKQALHAAAHFADVPIPKWKKPNPANHQQQTDTNSATPGNNNGASTIKPDAVAKLDLLDVALAWHSKYSQDLAWDAERAGWRRWSGTHWQLERTAEALDLQAARMMREVGVPVHSGSRTDGVLKYARGLCKQKFPLGQPLVNFKNGTLDLVTMQLRGHERADHLTRCLPHEYMPGADFSRLQQFLNGTIPDPVAQKAYMTHIGTALVGDLSLHKALILFGPTRSGKTTLLKLAQATLGYKPGQFPTSTLFSSESRGANSRATWVDTNPNLVCLDEFPQDALGGEGEELFKSMTAHGGVSMWLKYQDERDENTWTPKLMFATNNRLHYRDQSGALTRRLLIIECPNTVPETKQDGDLIKRLEAELGAFAAACIQLAIEAQKSRQYPESAQMSNLLNDIETNGDSIKLWLMENCIFEEGAFESTATLYQNYRYWCDENGVNAAGRPKMRDVITTYRPGVEANRQRVIDPETGEIKLVWGLLGVRLRTIQDDFPEDDPEPTDPVDPIPPTSASGEEAHTEASRSSTPVASQNLSTKAEPEGMPPESVVDCFTPNHQITGSRSSEMSQEAHHRERPVHDPVAVPPDKAVEQLQLQIDPISIQPGKTDVLRYFPDLMPSSSKRRLT